MNFPHELIPERNKFTKDVIYTEKLFSGGGLETVKKSEKCGSSVALRQVIKCDKAIRNIVISLVVVQKLQKSFIT